MLARRTELREVVENSQVQIEELRRQVEERQTAAASAAKALADTQKELEKALSFEADAKEKGLLIGKLRHEAVILNSHLTKALKQLNRGKVEDTIDRYVARRQVEQSGVLTEAGNLSRTTSSTSSASTAPTRRSFRCCRSWRRC